MLASECLLHRWCNTLGFRGLRDVTGEMLHHGGMPKEGLVSICCIQVNVATNGYKPCQWDRAQFWGRRIVTVASWVMVATVLQQTMHKRRGREGDYNSRKEIINVASGQQHRLSLNKFWPYKMDCLPVLRKNWVDFRYYFYPKCCKITHYIDVWLWTWKFRL